MTATLKLIVGVFLTLLYILPAQAQEVHVLSVQGAISPGSADYLVRGINKAAEAQVRLVVIELDTPGGLDTSMRDIIKAILASPVPVATYVSPKGARAASAGTYILYASHIAAMAPATNLGAATPVELGPSSGTPPEKPATPDKKGEKPAPDTTPNDVSKGAPQDAKTKKVVHDAAAYIRSLAELRGRNADWAEQAVREAVSLSAEAALQAKVVDVVATDIADLLKQIHGRKVKLLNSEVTLDTANLSVTRVEPDWRSELLAVIGNPGIAYILMLLGIYGLLYEFSNPGTLFPGVVGGICLLLALFALQLMPINYVGLALVILGVALMVSEAFLPSFGALGLGGIVAFVIGSVMLIDTDLPGYGISWALIVPIAVTTAVFTFIVASMALRALKRPVVTGAEELLGAEGEVLDDMKNEGWARVHSELWRVRSSLPLAHGTKVRVTARHDLILEVEAMNNSVKESDHV
ncbi:MAG: nodulation protein NfeD [Methylotenera sp.]|nr:nodulation protein NfeD [Methylotenera sp.]MDP1595317.1 nodulation protein NfeD [Methylotenera sp.]MDP1755205.1 nodulation protein NfeD [Methylotenera sp.]MDP1959477.1 nodulation protein NfeD [Methylotenera sp.]MDP2403874.1 nodulation protein NfeD [Methylotenera sp.]